MKKIFALLVLSVSLLFCSIDLQNASKSELMSIKGIGPVKAEQIIEYRKTNQIKSPEDLKNIKGFGNGVVSNIKENKTVSNMKMKEKEKKAKVEEKRKDKINKVKNSNKSAEEIKERKQKINEKAMERKKDIKEKREKMKEKKDRKNSES